MFYLISQTALSTLHKNAFCADDLKNPDKHAWWSLVSDLINYITLHIKCDR